MKKIILFLALLSLGVSKAQVVGGYLPVNSTKSATMGGLRVNGNETVTGTFSVGSTATITGALYSGSLGVNTTYTNSLTNFNLIHGTSTISMGSQSSGNPSLWLGGGADATNYSLAKSGSNLMINTGGANLYFQTGGGGNRGTWNSTGLRIGSGSNATAVLDVTGDAKVSTTFSLGSAQLTGGNTGTVAVLSDAVFQITFNSPSTNPADGVTYYFSNLNFPAQQTSTGGTVTIPYNCTLIGWDFNMSITGTVGSGETATLVAMANNATISVLSTEITFSNVTGYNGFSATGLSTNFTAGDKFNLRMISPTWATNPTQIYTGVTFWFVRRS